MLNKTIVNKKTALNKRVFVKKESKDLFVIILLRNNNIMNPRTSSAPSYLERKANPERIPQTIDQPIEILYFSQMLTTAA